MTPYPVALLAPCSQPVTVVQKVTGDVEVVAGGPRKIRIDTCKVKKRANKTETIVRNLEVGTRILLPVTIQRVHGSFCRSWSSKCRRLFPHT